MQADVSEFVASLVYKASARIVSKATQRNPISKNKKKAKKERKTGSVQAVTEEVFLSLWYTLEDSNQHHLVLRCPLKS